MFVDNTDISVNEHYEVGADDKVLHEVNKALMMYHYTDESHAIEKDDFDSKEKGEIIGILSDFLGVELREWDMIPLMDLYSRIKRDVCFSCKSEEVLFNNMYAHEVLRRTGWVEESDSWVKDKTTRIAKK